MNWRHYAACRDLTAEESQRLFFNRGRTPHETFELCESCPVRLACLAEADRWESVSTRAGDYGAGVWGGLTVPQRQARRVEAV